MIKVLFVCWGNICRSPMGEYILKDIVKEKGIEGDFYIASAATSTEEIGNPVYPPARNELRKHGINCAGHKARQVIKDDYKNFDIIIAMEELHRNIMIKRFFESDPEGKIHLCMEYADKPNQQIEDPWYTGRFEAVYNQIEEACEGLIKKLGY